ncbi:MAG: PIG-L family deacetylase, partial [Chloroflexota bacterium]|nr:PIG-L family deacetylase [Chloroflexota bacterium]
SLDPLVLSATREAEQRAAADVVGYAGISFLHQPDGALANDLAMRELLVREIRTFRPDAVLCNDPEMLFWEDGGVNHTDHRTAGLAAVDAVYPAARNPMAFPWLVREGLALHKVRRLYLFWTEKANAWVDVSATVERKVEALRAHASQIEKPDELGAELRKWTAEAGARIGVPAAESFRLIVLDEDELPDAGGSGAMASGAESDPAGAAVPTGQA